MAAVKYLLFLVGAFLVFALGITIYIAVTISDGMPTLDILENPKQNLATQIVSTDGELLDHFYIERRVSLPLDSIPKDFIRALIATEDKNFMDHWGVHVERIFKAALKNILSNRVEGASTITMQLARNMFLNQENTFTRKIREAFTAIQIERTYTKQEILEMYCNEVAFGRGAYGIQVASKLYFNKTPMELTTAECAFLVALLKAPERYNAIEDKERALTRRNLVLSLMFDQGYIGGEKYLASLEEPIVIKTGKGKSINLLAPHFVEMVRQKFSKEDNSLISYDLYRDGLVIHTTVNSRIQKYANEAVAEHLDEFQKVFNKSWSWKNNSKLLKSIIDKAIHSRADYKAAKADKRKQIESRLRNDRSFIDSVKNAATTIQTGLVVINPQTGEILAMVGASSKFMRENPDAKYSLNHASQIRRQAGSAFKPLVYALALEKGLTPSSMIECGPYSYTNPETGEVWSPAGGGCEKGEMITLYDALRKSINAVAARLITQVVTPREVVELARKLGIQSKLSAVPAIALGAGGEVSPLELVSAFGGFCFNGYHVNSYYITSVEDKFGNIVYQKKKTARINDAMNRGTSQTITQMLEGVISGGTAWRIKNYFHGISAAGKTGTTNDNADAWFIGYTPELVAGCWVGFDDLRIKLGSYGEGGKAAAPVWGRLMSKIYSDQILPFKQKRFDHEIISQRDSLIDQTFISEEKWDETYNIEHNKPKKENKEATAPNFPKLPKNDNKDK